MKKFIVILAAIISLNTSYIISDALSQWVPINSPQILSCLNQSGSTLFAGTMSWEPGYSGALFVSGNNGTTWYQTSLYNKRVFSLLVSGTNMFAGVSRGVYLSTDSGVNWVSVSSGFTYENISCLASLGSNIFAGCLDYPYNGIFLSSNNGQNWSQVNNGLPAGNSIVALAVLDSNLFASTGYNMIFRSTNNGALWTPVNNGIPVSKITSFAVIGERIFAGCVYQGSNLGFGVFMSTNNGENWNAVNTGLTSLRIMYLSKTGTNLLAATDSSVFFSSNYGTSWIKINEGFTSNSSYYVYASDNFIYSATSTTLGNNLWRRPISEITGVEQKDSESPRGFNLKQNYPNPFNPTTNIKFSISKTEQVKLIVYDVQGREVQTLVNEALKPGTYGAAFNGTTLNSGVYFYKLITDGFTETKKMLLIK